MTPAVLLILGIIDKSLELALRINADMPPELKQKHWEQQLRWMAFWQTVAEKLKIGE